VHRAAFEECRCTVFGHRDIRLLLATGHRER
jgi:hypothetical protein